MGALWPVAVQCSSQLNVLNLTWMALAGNTVANDKSQNGMRYVFQNMH